MHAATQFPVTERRDCTALAQARMLTILEAASSLLRQDYVILCLEPAAMSAKPVIWIANESRLARLADSDRALYYARGSDERGAYRIGQFEHMGCIVKWFERGH